MKQFASLLGIEYVKDKECRELHQVYGEFVEVKREFVVDFPQRIWYNNKCRETSRAALF